MTHISHNHKSDRLKKTCTYQEVQNNIRSQGHLDHTNFVTKIESTNQRLNTFWSKLM